MKTMKMSEWELQELQNRIKAMDNDEKQVVVDMLPVELCQNRVTRELQKKKQLEEGIENLIKIMG